MNHNLTFTGHKTEWEKILSMKELKEIATSPVALDIYYEYCKYQGVIEYIREL